jgi:hypothetical protein
VRCFYERYLNQFTPIGQFIVTFFESILEKCSATPTNFILEQQTVSHMILKAKQKLGETLNFDKQDVIDFTNFQK